MTLYMAKYSLGGEFFHRRFWADDIDHAQDQAQDACEEGEVVVEVFPAPNA